MRSLTCAFLLAAAACSSTSNDGATSNLPRASDPLTDSNVALPFGGDIAACEADTDAMWDRDVPKVGFADPHTDAVDAAVVAVMKKYGLPGLALVTLGSSTQGVRAARGYGFADPSRHELMNPDQTFRIGDYGRGVLEAAFLALGALPQDIEFSVAELVGDLPNVPPALDFEELFAGSEGWDDADYDPFAHATAGATRDQLLRTALATPPKNPPGKVIKPSHTGLLLLSYVMEKKFQLSLAEILTAGTRTDMSASSYRLGADFAIGGSSAKDCTDSEVHYVDDDGTPNPAYDHLPIEALGASSFVGSPLGIARTGIQLANLPKIAHMPGSTVISLMGGIAMINTWKNDPAVEAALASDLDAAVSASINSLFVVGPDLDAFTDWTTPSDLAPGAGRTEVYAGVFRLEGRFTDKFELRAKPAKGVIENVYGATCPVFRQRHDDMMKAGNVLISYQTFDAPDGHRRYQAVWARKNFN